MLESSDGSCFPKPLLAVNVCLACIDCSIAIVAFFQLLRLHSRSSQFSWTRQKVFHLLIGSSNMGYLFYFVFTLIATCKRWLWWSASCGFIFMACPEVLFLASFLLLLSFWVDLCHQAYDEDDEDEECSPRQSLLEKTLNRPNPINTNRHRKCFPFRFIPIGSRQRTVLVVIVSVFLLMIVSAVLIWIGTGKNLIDSSVVARVYVDFSAVAMIFLGGALACYGLLLFLKMRRVRSERASSEMWKVAGLAAVSVICFTSTALIALFTDVPLLYNWHQQKFSGSYASILVGLYYFIGSSVPSAFVLWVMRELPASTSSTNIEETRIITFIHDSSVAIQRPQSWTTGLQNQISRVSPI